MGIKEILLIAGAVCFFLDAFSIKIGKLSLFPLGWGLIVVSFIVK